MLLIRIYILNFYHFNQLQNGLYGRASDSRSDALGSTPSSVIFFFIFFPFFHLKQNLSLKLDQETTFSLKKNNKKKISKANFPTTRFELRTCQQPPHWQDQCLNHLCHTASYLSFQNILYIYIDVKRLSTCIVKQSFL